jgi:hypothetical protein
MTSEILGRPITGEVTPTREAQSEQWGAEKFLELLDELLAEPTVEAVRWRQYTPFFNDGEACIFSIRSFQVKLVSGDAQPGCTGVDDEDEDDDESPDWLDEYDVRRYNREAGRYEIKPEFGRVGEKLVGLDQSSSHFEDFLGETFGDHATITATKAGFDIVGYDHE